MGHEGLLVRPLLSLCSLRSSWSFLEWFVLFYGVMATYDDYSSHSDSEFGSKCKRSVYDKESEMRKLSDRMAFVEKLLDESIGRDKEERRGNKHEKSRKSKKAGKSSKKYSRWEKRVASARKRTWKARSHGEQFRVIDDALKPLQKARKLAEAEGEYGISEKIQEGEAVLQDRIKLLLFSDCEGRQAADIYSRKLDFGSDSDDERRMRAAVKEAKLV